MTTRNQIGMSGVTPIDIAIGNMPDACRDANGGFQLHMARVNLASIVCEAIETAGPSIFSSGHRISVSLPPDPVFFPADPARIKQILTNLLTNAAACTGPGGHIYLSADASGGVITIRVRDNGGGIGPA